jgi:acyl-CoA thioester hydrolase
MSAMVASGDAGRTDMRNYPLVRPCTLKQSDVDSTGSVGTIAVARLLEEGRYSIRSTIDHPIARRIDVGFVLARLRIELLAPIHYPGTVHVAIGVGRVGRSSFEYLTALFQDGRCATLSDATVAVRDRATGSGYELEPSFREALAPRLYPH